MEISHLEALPKPSDSDQVAQDVPSAVSGYFTPQLQQLARNFFAKAVSVTRFHIPQAAFMVCNAAGVSVQQELRRGESRLENEPLPELKWPETMLTQVEGGEQEKKKEKKEDKSATVDKRVRRYRRMILRPIKKSSSKAPVDTRSLGPSKPVPDNSEQSRQEEKTAKRRKDYSWLTNKEREHWKEDWGKKAEAAAEFSKRMRDQQKNIKQHEEEVHRRLFARVEQEISQNAILASRNMEEERKQRMLDARAARFEEKRKERLELLKFAGAVPKRIEVPARIVRKSKGSAGVAMPELERAKQAIAEKRDVHHAAPSAVANMDPEERERRFQEILQKYAHEKKGLLAGKNPGKSSSHPPVVFNVKAMPRREEENRKQEASDEDYSNGQSRGNANDSRQMNEQYINDVDQEENREEEQARPQEVADGGEDDRRNYGEEDANENEREAENSASAQEEGQTPPAEEEQPSVSTEQ